MVGAAEIIDNPEKIGVGGYGNFGPVRMVDDVGSLGATWFYDWTPGLSRFAVEGWSLGSDVGPGGTDGDRALALGATAEAWAQQVVPIEGGKAFRLSAAAKGDAASRGGVAVDFLDAEGARVGGGWLPLGGGAGRASTGDLWAPAAARTAGVVLWGEAGEFLLDDVSLRSDGGEALLNGGFEAARRLDAETLPALYVPMAWGARDAMGNLGMATDAGVLLGFNEPDFHTQADMGVDEALALWPRLEATGARLGSPATTTPQTLGAGAWLPRFMAGAEAADLRVDFVAVHYYTPTPDVGAFRHFLERTHAAYDRPIWVTEWALLDWSNTGRFSFADTARFLRDGALMMDELPFVERHAWFGLYDELDGIHAHTHLMEADGTPTPVGEAFRALTAAGEVVPEPDPTPTRPVEATGETLRVSTSDVAMVDGRGVLAVEVAALLANDRGHDGRIEVISNARHGEVALSEDGTRVLYRFDPERLGGKDGFSYRLHGADGSRDLARAYLLIDEDGTPPGPSPEPPPVEGETVLAINLGSSRLHTAADGMVFAADATGVGRAGRASGAIAGTEDDALYLRQAYADEGLAYRLALDEGTYAVRLHFAETHEPNFREGALVFDVVIEDRIPEALDDLDVFARVGARTAYMHEEVVEVDDGALDVWARKMAAIEVIRLDGADLLA